MNVAAKTAKDVRFMGFLLVFVDRGVCLAVDEKSTGPAIGFEMPLRSGIDSCRLSAFLKPGCGKAMQKQGGAKWLRRLTMRLASRAEAVIVSSDQRLELIFASYNSRSWSLGA
jgi:hypothetical protein